MSERQGRKKPPGAEQGPALRTAAQAPESAHSTIPRRAAAGLAQIPRALWRAGNAAIGQLLRRTGGGRPLAPDVRGEMEGAFGADFTGVRVHDDTQAAATADTLSATAFTQGADIYLGHGAPAPESAPGKELLAHELAHVVQQSQAGADIGQVSRPGDGFEQAADQAAQHVMQGRPAEAPASGTPPAIQRQERPPGPGISRDEAQKMLAEFLKQELAAQGGQSLRVTPEVRNAVEQIFARDPIGIQDFLQRSSLPGDPSEFAALVARRLPTTVDPARVAHLSRRRAAATPTRTERVRRLAERTEPAAPPPSMQESQWRFDQEAKDVRRGEGAIGPFSLDLLRIGRIARGLPGALGRQPATPPPQARAYPQIEQAIQQVAPNALVPAEASGRDAGSFADAREVARGLAQLLDVAQQQRRTEIDLRLGADYNKVQDRGAIYSELRRIALLVRDSLPHRASAVSHINVFFGERLVTRIALSRSE